MWGRGSSGAGTGGGKGAGPGPSAPSLSVSFFPQHYASHRLPETLFSPEWGCGGIWSVLEFWGQKAHNPKTTFSQCVFFRVRSGIRGPEPWSLPYSPWDVGSPCGTAASLKPSCSAFLRWTWQWTSSRVLQWEQAWGGQYLGMPPPRETSFLNCCVVNSSQLQQTGIFMTSPCTRSSVIGSFLRENPSALCHRLFFTICTEASG